MYGSIFFAARCRGEIRGALPLDRRTRQDDAVACLVSSAETAMATARYVSRERPANGEGHICFSIASMYSFWFELLGVTDFFPKRARAVGRPAPELAQSSLWVFVATRIMAFTSP